MPTHVGPGSNEYGLVFAFDTKDTKNSYLGEPTVNYISNPTEEMARGEFGQYRDLAPIFNSNGLVPHSLSMDIRVNKPGGVYVYMQNGSTTRHGFVGASVNATTRYQRFYFDNITPTLNDSNVGASTLATYTGYGSGVTPTVKNIQLELKTHSTPFVNGTRSATEALKDLTGTTTINLAGVSFDSIGQIVFDGTDDAISCNTPAGFNSSGNWTIETWFKINGAPSSTAYMNVIVDMNPTGGSANMICVNWSDMRLQYRSRPVGGGYTDINGSVLSQNVWYNATVVRDGTSSTKLYLNGVQDGGTYVGNLPNGNQSTFNIGRWTDGTVFANASISIVKIYNKSLSDSEVLNNFRMNKARFNI